MLLLVSPTLGWDRRLIHFKMITHEWWATGNMRGKCTVFRGDSDVLRRISLISSVCETNCQTSF
jgi:hypothetical protein